MNWKIKTKLHKTIKAMHKCKEN